MNRRFASLLLFLCVLLTVQASVQTKRIEIDYVSITENGVKNSIGMLWQSYNPENADSIFRFTITGHNGRCQSNPYICNVNSKNPGCMGLYAGHSLKVDASPTGILTTTRDVVKVEIQFANTYYNNASQVTARFGSVTFNNDTNNPIVTWTGGGRAVELYMEKYCEIKKVWVTIKYRDGADCVAHPVFDPVDQSDFRTATKQVTITSPTAGAKVRYRLDNGTFVEADSPVRLTIDKTTLIRAYCMKDGVGSHEDSCRIIKNTSNYQVKDKAFYQSKKYTWVDVKGVRGVAGATVTSDMTEEATTTEQIMALLKAVYTDPTIPGQVYMNVGEQATYAGYTTNPRNRQHGFPGNRDNEIADQWGIDPLSQDPVEGYTALLVKVRDDFVRDDYRAGIFRHGDQSATTYSAANDYGVYRAISETYESVQMLYGTRVGQDNSKGWPEEGYNPGTLYFYTGALNRFFIISKGSAMWSGSIPLLGLYEELAPDFYFSINNEGFQGMYATFADGYSFPITHVCPGVAPQTGHMTQMDPDQQTYQMNNMALFLPDYRLKYWERTAQSPYGPLQWEWQTNRNGLNGSSGIQHYNGYNLPGLMLYTVKLAAIAEPTSREHVYRSTPSWSSVLDGITPATGVPQEYWLYEVTDDGEGNETLTPLNGGNTLSANSFSYEVPQHETGYSITYLIKARPQGSDIDPVLSNKATVYIPGYQETRYGLIDIGEATLCRYDMDKQVNAYCNYVRLSNDPAYPIMADQLEVGTEMTLLRHDHQQQEMGTVATVTITGKTTDGAKTTFNYRVDINDALQDEVDVSRYHAATGTFTAGADGKVHFGDLYIADQFSASTATNEHPSSYYYQLKMVDALGHALESHLDRVDVYKTGIDVSITPYSLSQVQGDTDRGLGLDRQLSILTTVGNDADVLSYSVLCDGSLEVARALRSPDGKYYTKGVNADGQLVDTGDPAGVPFTDGRQTMELGLTAHLDLDHSHTFVPVVSANTHDIDGDLVVSTYGADKKSEPIGSLTVTVSNLERSAPWAGDPSWMMSYASDVTLISEVLDAQSRYLYRLWRVNPDGSETLLNGQPEDTGSSWSTSYGNLESTDATVTVHDIFNDLPLYAFADQTFNVTYIARLYSRYGNTGGSGAPRRAYGINDFTILQASQTVSYGMEVVTNVGVVEQGRAPISTVYYNLMGKSADRPFEGVNIIVTRYSDGSTETTKVIR